MSDLKELDDDIKGYTIFQGDKSDKKYMKRFADWKALAESDMDAVDTKIEGGEALSLLSLYKSIKQDQSAVGESILNSLSCRKLKAKLLKTVKGNARTHANTSKTEENNLFGMLMKLEVEYGTDGASRAVGSRLSSVTKLISKPMEESETPESFVIRQNSVFSDEWGGKLSEEEILHAATITGCLPRYISVLYYYASDPASYGVLW